jgi:hypothetical protein
MNGMKKHSLRKLPLKTTTLRTLDSAALGSANGGAIVKTNQSVNRGDCTGACPSVGFCD